jgi:hypothetical protein
MANLIVLPYLNPVYSEFTPKNSKTDKENLFSLCPIQINTMQTDRKEVGELKTTLKKGVPGIFHMLHSTSLIGECHLLFWMMR